MRRAAWLAAILLAATPALAHGQESGAPPADPVQAAAPPEYGFEVVRAYPHDAGAFTQGLAYVDGVLFESTGRTPSTLRRVRLEDGVVLKQVALEPELFGEGLTEIGGRLYSLTWKNGRGFVWNAADLTRTAEFPVAGEGWGITDDGRRLIVSDGTPTLRFLDPETRLETGRVQITFRGRPLPNVNELEWIDGEVWANVWRQDALVRIDPATGVVVGVVDLTDLLSRPYGAGRRRRRPERRRLGRREPPPVRHGQALADALRDPDHGARLGRSRLISNRIRGRC